MPATIALDAAASGTWDAIVVGAGPAGASVAARLAADGLATLLVERKAFPRDKVCGGCLNGHAVALLARAGVVDELRAQGARTLSSVHLYAGGRRVVLDLMPSAQLPSRPPAQLAVTRATLDAVLVRAAIAAGCAFLPETIASVVGDDPSAGDNEGVRYVALEKGGGARVNATARVVVIACGLGHQALREVVIPHEVIDASARVGVGVVADAGIVEVLDGVVSMVVGRGGYVGLTGVERGRVNMAAAFDAGFLKAAGGPAAAVRTILASAHIEVTPALDALEWRGTVPLTRRLPVPMSHRIFVIGDAAGYVEPFTGEGMAWAISAAHALAPLAVRAVATWDASIERQWRTTYDTLVRRQQRWCRAIARVLRHPAAANLLVASLSRYPGLARPFLSGVAAGGSPVSIEDH